MMVAVRMINAAVVMRVPPHGFGLVCWSWLVSFSFVFGFVQCGVEHDDELFGLVGREPVGVGAYGIAFADGQDDAVAFRRVWGSFAVPFRIVVGAQVEFVAPSTGIRGGIWCRCRGSGIRGSRRAGGWGSPRGRHAPAIRVHCSRIRVRNGDTRTWDGNSGSRSPSRPASPRSMSIRHPPLASARRPRSSNRRTVRSRSRRTRTSRTFVRGSSHGPSGDGLVQAAVVADVAFDAPADSMPGGMRAERVFAREPVGQMSQCGHV